MVNQKKLKVGIVCYPSVGGSGIVATGLGTELARLGHQVHFISYDEPFTLDVDQKNIYFHKVDLNGYELFKYPDYTLPLAVKIVDINTKYKLDILHVHYAVPHATAALLAKDISHTQKIPFPNIITTLHGTDITLLGRDKTLMPAIKFSIESSCGVTAVSNSLKKDTIKVLRTDKDIEVIHNFYNPKEIKKSRKVIRKSLGIKEEDFLVIHLSNMRKVKRIPDLLEIMSRVVDNKNIKLLILAGGNSEQYLPMIKELGIGKNVIIKKNVLDIENYINASDIGMYASGEESFGMGILETMSYGKPVLATRAGGIVEFMQNNKTGFLFKVGDVDGFAQKLLELSYNLDIVKKLGENAKSIAQQGFSGGKIVDKYIEYYRKIIKN